MEGKKTRPSENQRGKMDATTKTPPRPFQCVCVCVCVRVACYLIFVSSRERERGEKKIKKTELPRAKTRQIKLRGQKLKGQPKQDRSPKTTNLSTFPRQSSKSLTRSQTAKQHSFEKNTAGWRGPWAAPLLWRVAPGDLGTEEPKLPHQGNRPR